MTEVATTVGKGERHHDEITFLHPAHLRSDRLDDADGLVAHAPSIFGRLQFVVGPKIAAADTGSRDAHKRIGWFFDFGVGHVLNANVAGAIHDGCTHSI